MGESGPKGPKGPKLALVPERPSPEAIEAWGRFLSWLVGRPWWQRPPFAPGNEMAVKHGAFSPRRVDPLAADLIERMLADAGAPGSTTGYLLEASFQPALWSWARAEARCQLVSEWLWDNGGDIEPNGEVRKAAEYLRRWEAQALKHREQLGLSPLARARMGRDVAAGRVDMARVMAELEAEESAAAGRPVDVDASEE